ncbi:hypothetical protein HDU98_003312 [Podochytrium sp. JEL0797]|nr:hypothetical protein HDU98_009364 [Podochytrium sp. JEL0797]KAJ3076448.1 hypothetical protein HDU98_003312 [Podochytrium sp. JEL0797]
MPSSQSSSINSDRTYTIALVVSDFFMAMAFEISLRGIILAIGQIHQNPAAKTTPIIILTGNVFGLFSAIFFIWGNLTNQGTCFGVDLAMNLTYHLFMLTFDGFILYKSYLASSKAQWYAIIAVLAFWHRMGWAAVDLIQSYGSWDADFGGVCVWNQYSVTSQGYMSGDILCDLIATVTALIYCWKYFSSNVRKLFIVMSTENVLRSSISLLITSLSIWLVSHKNPIEVMYFSSISVYLFSQILNSEFYFCQIRTTALVESHGGVGRGRVNSIPNSELTRVVTEKKVLDHVRMAMAWAAEEEEELNAQSPTTA